MEMKHTRDNQSNLLIYLRTELNSQERNFALVFFCMRECLHLAYAIMKLLDAIVFALLT